MSLLTWSPMFSVGVTEIDEQHKKLIEIANRLNDQMSSGKGREVLDRIFNELISYTQSHFATEEKLMATNGYSASDKHKAKHKGLVTAVVELKKKHDAGQDVLTSQVMAFLRDWLTKHILNTDKALGRELNQKGIK
jgi:hemerythrin